MNKVTVLIICFLIILILTACTMKNNIYTDFCGFQKDDFTIVEESDSHSGVHSDGFYYLVLDCSENQEKVLELLTDWRELPLSENLDLIMYGGEKDGISYEYNLAEKFDVPRIENGYYYFYDRHSEAVNCNDDSGLFDRNSFNFSFALYDVKTQKLYYFEYDT